MSELSSAERLAALQARRKPAAGPPPMPTATPAVSDATRRLPADQAPTSILPLTSPAAAQHLPPVHPGFDPLNLLRANMNWSRVATGGASVVSFAAMVAAMGPVFDTGGSTETAAADTTASAVVGAEAQALPVAPPVSVAVIAPVDPNAITLVPAEAGAPVSIDPSVSIPEGSAAPVAAPAGQAPATQPPATQAPATQAPVTQAPATQPPTTVPPTAAPTTAPPPTAPPTTAPPRTTASGG